MTRPSVIYVHAHRTPAPPWVTSLREAFDVHSLAVPCPLDDALFERRADLLLVDIALFDGASDDWALVNRLRARNSAAPVVGVSDSCTEQERIDALRGGAEDLMCQPFSVTEARERLLAKLRARRARSAELYSGEHLRVDFDGADVRVDGAPVVLARRELQLLRALVTRRNQVLTREALLDDVWRSVSVSDRRTVDTHIRKLRAKLGAAGQQIETVTRRGYRFVEGSVPTSTA